MEWLSVKMRSMGLRRFYILVSALSLLTALLCTAVTFWVCIRLREQIAPAGLEIEYDLYGNPVSSEFASPPSAEQWRMANLIQSLQYVLPVIYFTAAVIVSGAVIYRCKLREPIRMLQSGAQRIMEQDLDFTISSDSGDELGQLCAAFEKMRGQLQKNNRELWRQAEERRRLNAAFSHDLRNPVTVLKGSVRLMEKSLAPDNLPPENSPEKSGADESLYGAHCRLYRSDEQRSETGGYALHSQSDFLRKDQGRFSGGCGTAAAGVPRPSCLCLSRQRRRASLAGRSDFFRRL